MAKQSPFTLRMRRSITLAQQEALRFNQPAVRPEHLLLGMLDEGAGMASVLIRSLRTDPAVLRVELEAELPQGAEPVKELPDFPACLTPEASAALELAQIEARRLKHHYVGEEHVLLALLRQGGAAADLLARFQITYAILLRALPDALQLLPETKEGSDVKRYNLALPQPLFSEVERIAEREGTTILEVLRRAVKLSLLVDQIQQRPGTAIIIREGETDRELVVL